MSGSPGDDVGLVPEIGAFRAGVSAPRRPLAALRPYLRHAALAAAGALAACLALQTFWYERDIATNALDWPSIGVAIAFTICLASGLSFVSRRFYASIATACGLMVLLTVVSVMKYSYVRASLYALDFYNYATWQDLNSFRTLFFSTMVQGLCVIALAIALAWLLFATDPSRARRARSAGVLALAIVVLCASYAQRGYRGKIAHYFGGHHVSAVITSVPEAFSIGGHLEAADRGGRIDSAPAPHLQNAIPGEKPPTLISILHESSFSIDMFSIQCGGRTPDALYTSSNGSKHDLRVETFNGSTWMTEYGLNLGLSTYYFGDNRIWFSYPMENKIHDSLAMQLRRNGYRSVAVYPSPRDFLNTGPFYASIGFDKLLDVADLKAPTEFERDRFYYASVIDQIRAHKASGSTAPLYVATWINATHAPYDFVAHAGVPPEPGSICAKDGAWAEYIRRLLMSEDDLAWLSERLKAEFPGEKFMILGYGDHHPEISREFLEPNASRPYTPPRGSIGYKTFFRITGVNFQPDWSVVPDSVDMPFLGNVMMLAARVRRFGFYNDRDKLMELCKGRYSDCPHQDEILSFHDRLVKAGVVENR